ncbi:MAG: tetratricopeptide repeat protein [Treponema sp.]|jgi:tetratricopeptide (TPR) repeat protein|nr:tetratricopeptide repeat protein [Treponema sp.]
MNTRLKKAVLLSCVLFSLTLVLVLSGCLLLSFATLATLGDEDDAQTRDEITEIKGGTAEDYFNRGNGYMETREWKKAVSDYTKAIALKTDYAAAYFKRGNGYVETKEWEKAISDYTKAIDLKTDDTAAYFNRGIANYNRGDLFFHIKFWNNALADFNKVIELTPPDAGTYMMCASYMMRGLLVFEYLKEKSDGNLRNSERIKEVIADYTKALEIDPDYWQAYWNRGDVYLRLGEDWWRGGNGIVFVAENKRAAEYYDLAINDYENAKKLAPPEDHEEIDRRIWQMQAAKKRIDTWLAERKVVDPIVEKRQNPNGLNRSQYKEISYGDLCQGVLSGDLAVGTKMAFLAQFAYKPSGKEYIFYYHDSLVDIISNHDFARDMPKECFRPSFGSYFPDYVRVYVTVKRNGGGGECYIDIIDW